MQTIPCQTTSSASRQGGPVRRLLAALSFVTVSGLALVTTATAFAADSGRSAAPLSGGAAQVGGVLPGGAVISAAVSILPVGGGEVVSVPLAADGSFKFTGLAPGRYQLALTSQVVTRQTQGATFGEKVNAGLQAAGGALAPGANARDINSGMPNRISMNVTVPKQNLQMVVDGAPVAVDVAGDGQFSGSATVSK